PQFATGGLDLRVAVVMPFTAGVGAEEGAAMLQPLQLQAQRPALLVTLGLALRQPLLLLLAFLAARLEEALAALLALAGGRIALNHLGPDVDALGAGRRPLAKMHTALVIGPAIDFGVGERPAQAEDRQQYPAHGNSLRQLPQLSPKRPRLPGLLLSGRFQVAELAEGVEPRAGTVGVFAGRIALHDEAVGLAGIHEQPLAFQAMAAQQRDLRLTVAAGTAPSFGARQFQHGAVAVALRLGLVGAVQAFFERNPRAAGE